ncbi:MAG: AMMECR1 domain-containing protein [Candidatus Obscuribacterales bacterium]|nr:AMMECR1 domain-containing protein [Candidatus Obscuribacterales bacterium]
MIYAVLALIPTGTGPKLPIFLSLIFCCLALIAKLPSEAAQLPVKSLPEIVHETMLLHFGGEQGQTSIKEFADNLPVRKEFQKPGAVFVTLSSQQKTRACWGTLYPQHKSIAAETVYSTLGALTKEYRYPPIKKSELNRLKIQVTIVKTVVPITDTSAINPFKQGILVRSGGKSGVILPGEAGDAYYAMVQAKLKAGIKSGEPYQLYKIEADIHD